VLRKVRARVELIDAATDNPTIQADYSTGGKVLGQATWNGFNWNSGTLWAAPDDTAWTSLNGSAPEDDGQHPYPWHVNKRLRFVRVRLRSSSPAARLTLRALELFYRVTGKSR